jgi:cob(I)alamin adenosyltransferase
MVNLTRIYTRTGDEGTTALGDLSRTSKNDLRLAAYADVDEANSCLGVALALGNLPEPLPALITRIQNDLFDVGADLCTPVTVDPAYPPLRVEETYVTRLEADCDTYNDELEKLRSFVLPAGTPGAALLHVARTVVRRALHLGGSGSARGHDEPADRPVPEPTVRPALHPGPGRQHTGRRRAGRRAVDPRREPLTG